MWLPVGIDTEAAPAPSLGSGYQTSDNWVAMDVPQLLGSFSLRVDIEVVVSRLPDVGLWPGSGESLLHDLDDFPESYLFGFGGKEVNMIRHDDVSQDVELVFDARLFEDPLDQIARVFRTEDVAMANAAEVNEVEVPGLLKAIQAQGHGGSIG